jgi:hypothetical protein
MDALEEMRRRDVGHVERRVLPHQHDVDAREIEALGGVDAVMVALDVAHRERLHLGHHLAVPHREAVRRVIEQPVPARLRLQQQREGRIAGDPDLLDRVHLDRDGEAHGGSEAEWRVANSE